MIPPGNLPGEIRVIQCPKCGTSWLAGFPPPHDYWEGGQKSAYADLDAAPALSREAESDLRLVELFAVPGELLDIGCGLGDFVGLAAKRGWKAHGIDASARAVAAARGRGLSASVGTAEQPDLPSESFDAVTMRDVLEHLKDPLGGLESAASLLKPGGIVLIKTPNESSLYKGIARALWRASFHRIRRPLSFVYYVPHYFAFTEVALRLVLPRFGLDLVRFIKTATPAGFSRAKLKQHGAGSRWVGAVSLMIPYVQALAAAIGRENKLVLLARKQGVKNAC